MISSTVKDMLDDRNSIVTTFKAVPFTRLIGTDPIKNQSYTSSPFQTTKQMAVDCHLYILLLGRRYGYESKGGKSATEEEFDSAYEANPTKILVLLKNSARYEKRQKEFIERVSDYYSGYWVTKYENSKQLKNIVMNSFEAWLIDRAAIGYKLNYFDHFVRYTIQKLPSPEATLNYSVKQDLIELDYKMFGKNYVVHIDKTEIYTDFWGTVAKLDQYFDDWKKNL